MGKDKINVWATNGHVPGNVCEDARLRSPTNAKLYHLRDGIHGQAGWDIGIPFATFADLTKQLHTMRSSPPYTFTSKLAILAHGDPGVVEVDGLAKRKLSTSTLGAFRVPLSELRTAMSWGSTLIFMGCLAGNGKAGAKFLIELSKYLPGTRVVAFETVGFSPGGKDMARPGQFCSEPGMRITSEDRNAVPGTANYDARQVQYARLWKDLKKLPWASEESKFAVIAKGGKIIKYGFSTPGRPASRK